ncbi:tRNA (adenosine(37)-N6)-threonylcarbamoyltransferase complex ATPase subunit type 1 TsaE [Achromobacter sp. GG226]|uniref:tRNA (adenosine(37)-N6)-threonylcarbamoyltransferase complex ATPase subunit type 1 TsaE n=1 Tax=Verticiella alkaliphila TaxID=2779529 RepID=UPI001C0E127D|nr:tRNA (adenosine(37)-N6)-threonylcarbamoyltransferase complex ATPase subunit type 1 TsaE [Verticiella sp. GG226]MBU4612908.1 tRNA (adenosine(37)-N6)-threonylcarbamoyltransferase complex ATPase subunit type 1 TsaE [Verticiella sp. GG226]
MTNTVLTLALPDEAATESLAQRIAPLVRHGGRIHLAGDLGAGKTTFARALLRACGISGRIKSPTFALVEVYELSNLYFYHFDFYRFTDPREWLDAGFRDALRDDALVLIEWAEKAGEALPPPDMEIALDVDGDGRLATLTASSERGRSWLSAIGPSVSPTMNPPAGPTPS